MGKIMIPFVILSFLVFCSQNCLAEVSLADVDDKIKEGVTKINDLMVEKNRVQALAAVEEVAVKLKENSGDAEISVYQNLKRLEFYLRKYEWDIARRILKDLMTRMGLEYEPTYE